MGLIKPRGPSWAYCSHNISGTPVLATTGTQFTSGAANADGTAVTLLSALSHDVEYLRVRISGETLTTGIDNTALVSILIDPAGGVSWATLIPSLLVSTGVPSATLAAVLEFEFPIWIPAGASIGIQARSAAAATPPVMRAVAHAYGGNKNPASWWTGQRVTAIGIDAANSRGTTHTPGGTGTFSAWTNFGSTLDADCGALQWAVSGAFASAAWTQLYYEMQFGVASAMIGAPIMHSTTTAEQGWSAPIGLIFRSLPSGTQLMVRGTCSAAAIAQGVAAYAVH